MKQKAVFVTVLVALLVVIAVLLTRKEGDKTRAAIREAGNEVGDATRQGMREGIRDAAADALEEAKALPGKVTDKIGGLKPQPGKDAPATEKARERTHPQDLVTGAFRLGQQAVKAVDDIGQDLLALDLEEEVRLGREAHAELSKNKVVDQPEQMQRIDRLAKPLLNLRQRKDVSYTFTILDDEVVNAFSHLGGYVYINRGLLEFVADDAELQFVLGHEIAHVDLKHCVRQFTYTERASELGTEVAGRMTQLIYGVLALGYSEDQEFEADENAFRGMLKVGRTRDAALEFSRHFVKHFDEHEDIVPARPKDVFAAVETAINGHFASHPPGRERLERLEAIKGGAGKVEKDEHKTPRGK